MQPSVPVQQDGTERIPWGFAEVFVISQTVLPALLFLPGTQPIRLVLRIGPFVISLLALAWWMAQADTREPETPHPARPWLIVGLVYVGLMTFHPLTNSLRAASAQIALYLAVLAPVFWAPSMVRSPLHLKRLITLLLICNGANAIVGVLQVYDPIRWLPAEFSTLVTESSYGLGPVTYIGPDGQRIVRPPGLFDTPGAVAGPAMYAALMGVVYAASRIRAWQRLMALGLAFASVAAIYLSQVRVSLGVLGIMLVIYVLTLLGQNRRATATAFAGMGGLLLVVAYTFAVTLGGESIVARVMTLFERQPFELYYASRGGQLVYAFNDLLFDFPLGAGLGRWGMAANYFADRSNLASPSIWAEIQFTGWMIDGGLVLVVCYVGALMMTSLHEVRLTFGAPNEYVRIAAGAVAAVNIGTAALIFSFTPFVTQIGIQYWFLAGALHGVATYRSREPERGPS